jgi:DNA-binding transcriptional MerR regulator
MDQANERIYKIGELADAAGVTSRTIRYYTGEGLLPPPDARGAYALYGEDHLNRLRLIARLKESYLPLGEIKALLGSLTPEQVVALIAEYEQQARAPSSALSYVAQVLAKRESGQLAEGRVEYSGPQAIQRPASQPPSPSAALGVSGAPAAPAPMSLPLGRAEPAGSLPETAPAAQATRGRLLERLLPRRSAEEPRREQPPDEERWRRVTLAPGVELHLREPLASGLRERVEELIARARELLSPER